MVLAILGIGFSGLIDFNPPIGRVPVVVKLLAEKTGEKLSVGPSLTDEVVDVIATQRPAQEIKDQLAYALEAKWTKIGESEVLARPKNWDEIIVRRTQDKYRVLIETTLKEHPRGREMSVDEIVAEAAHQRNFRNSSESLSPDTMEEFSTKTPAGELLDTLIARVTPAGLAQRAPRRTVFSNHATAAQTGLPALGDALTTFVEKHNPLAASIRPTIPQPQPYFGSNELDNWGQVDPGTMKILLVADFDTQNSIVLKVYSAGKLVGMARRMIVHYSRSGVADKAVVPVSARTRSFLEKRTPLWQEDAILTDSALAGELAQPTKSEVLAIGHSEALAAVQEEEQKPLVAVVPDSMVFRPFLVDKQGMLRLQLYRSFWTDQGGLRETHDGWTVFRTQIPTPQMSRTLLESTLSTARKEGRLSLDAWTSLLVRDRSGDLRAHEEFFAFFGMPPRRDWISNIHFLRFFGLLNGSQRDTLRRVGQLAADDLSSAQRSELAAAIFDSRSDGFSNASSSGATGLSDPTEAFPAGVGGPFAVHGEFKQQPSWYVTSADKAARPPAELELWTVATQLAAGERPDLFLGNAKAKLADLTFYPGEAVHWDFRLNGGTGYSLVTSLWDGQCDISKPSAFGGLPEADRTFIQNTKAKMIDEAEKMRTANPGSRKTPPPRTP